METVERWIPGANIRKDLFGFADLLAIRDQTVLAVQVTSRSNLAARIRKIGDSPLLGLVRKAGISIAAHGWGKDKAGKWTVTIRDLS